MRVAFSLVSVVSLLLLSGCSGPDGTGKKDRPALDDTGDTDSDRPEVTLTVVAPRDDAEFDADEPVPLEVTAKRGSRAQDIESATWTIGGWTGSGATTEATGLPSGAHEVEVEVEVDGDTYRASVDITVLEPVQTLFSYAGTLEADVIADTEFGEFDDHCSTPITFTLDGGTISGTSTCEVFADFDLDPILFSITGSARGGTVTGALVMSVDGSDARTPFDGTGNAGGPLSATFDSTHRSSDGSVRIVGSWSASPQ